MIFSKTLIAINLLFIFSVLFCKSKSDQYQAKGDGKDTPKVKIKKNKSKRTRAFLSGMIKVENISKEILEPLTSGKYEAMEVTNVQGKNYILLGKKEKISKIKLSPYGFKKKGKSLEILSLVDKDVYLVSELDTVLEPAIIRLQALYRAGKIRSSDSHNIKKPLHKRGIEYLLKRFQTTLSSYVKKNMVEYSPGTTLDRIESIDFTHPLPKYQNTYTLILLPDYDHNGAFSGDFDSIKVLIGAFSWHNSVVLKRVSSVEDIQLALDESKDNSISMLLIGGHGTPDGQRMRLSETNYLTTQNANEIFTEARRKKFKNDGEVFLHGCSAGYLGTEENLADAVARSSEKLTIAPTKDLSSKDVGIATSGRVLLYSNGVEISYIAGRIDGLLRSKRMKAKAKELGLLDESTHRIKWPEGKFYYYDDGTQEWINAKEHWEDTSSRRSLLKFLSSHKFLYPKKVQAYLQGIQTNDKEEYESYIHQVFINVISRNGNIDLVKDLVKEYEIDLSSIRDVSLSGWFEGTSLDMCGYAVLYNAIDVVSFLKSEESKYHKKEECPEIYAVLPFRSKGKLDYITLDELQFSVSHGKKKYDYPVKHNELLRGLLNRIFKDTKDRDSNNYQQIPIFGMDKDLKKEDIKIDIRMVGHRGEQTFDHTHSFNLSAKGMLPDDEFRGLPRGALVFYDQRKENNFTYQIWENKSPSAERIEEEHNKILDKIKKAKGVDAFAYYATVGKIKSKIKTYKMFMTHGKNNKTRLTTEEFQKKYDSYPEGSGNADKRWSLNINNASLCPGDEDLELEFNVHVEFEDPVFYRGLFKAGLVEKGKVIDKSFVLKYKAPSKPEKCRKVFFTLKNYFHHNSSDDFYFVDIEPGWTLRQDGSDLGADYMSWQRSH
jgi:hypothetical protein